MAKSTITSQGNFAKRLYSEKLFRRNVADSYFSRFMGESMDSMVYVKRDLEKGKGEEIRFGFVPSLSGGGVEEGQQLEGNEEAINKYKHDVRLKQYRHAVRDDGEFSEQISFFDLRQEEKTLIQEWGSTKIDQLCFDAVNDDTNTSHILYAEASAGNFTVGTTPATVKAALTSATNCALTLDLLSDISTWAETGGNETIVPLRPLKVDGEEMFVLLCHPDVLATLRKTSDFKQAMREARERGKDNPLFKGAEAVWANIIIHKHRRAHKATDGGAGAQAWAKCALLGQSAVCMAHGKAPKLTPKNFDYDNEYGIAWSMIMKAEKPMFNSATYGSVSVYVTRDQISDA